MPSHLRLGHPRGSFPLSLPVKILNALLPSSILATWPAHLNLLVLITLTILCERYKLLGSSLWSLLHTPFSSRLGPNIRLRIPFSNTLNLHSSVFVRDHVSLAYSTTEQYFCFVYFKFLNPWREIDKTELFGLNNNKFSALNVIFSHILKHFVHILS